jgi:predicted acyl esterase
MQDGEEVIRQLSAMPNSNGNVGMFGVSWSGFNSLQMAMRRPPALKAIHAVHASDDLFNDDVHYIDGNLHLDPYHLFINHELGLPRTPDYELSDEYFASRFDRRPWTFTYLGKQLDGEFWRSKSLREDYSRIDIPVYLLGGCSMATVPPLCACSKTSRCQCVATSVPGITAVLMTALPVPTTSGWSA